jgi:GNAT superfamily N-acetyltransferase
VPAIAIREVPIATLDEHATIPIAFEVDRVLEVSLLDGGLAGITLAERAVDRPWTKNYDADDNDPLTWPRRFEVSRWGLVAAFENEQRVGGIVIAHDTAGLNMLEGRTDLAIIWDLRIAPAHRNRGIGTALFQAAESWARARGCRTLRVETQTINVAACRFYRRMGCTLGRIDRFAYPDLPDEVMLLWSKPLHA